MRNSTAKEDLLLASKIGELTNKKRAQIAIQSRTEARNKVKDKILRSMQDGDTVFYSINPAGNSYQLNIPSVFGQETMSIFADQTGGSAFLLKKETDLDLIFRQLTSELRAQYLLQYYTDSPAGVGAFVPLQVSVPGAAQPRIRARKGYFVKK
jgi:VWFA-related protein